MGLINMYKSAGFYLQPEAVQENLQNLLAAGITVLLILGATECN